MTALRNEIGKLIYALIRIPREQRTPAMDRLLVNLVAAVDEYDSEVPKGTEERER